MRADALPRTNAEADFRLQFTSGLEAIRPALASCCDWVSAHGCDTEETASVELLLAEVLTNVHEHAYGGTPDRPIWLEMQMRGGRLEVQVEDEGVALPEGHMPMGQFADAAKPLLEQPEGGYGWFLIRALARDLDYRREGGKNRLSFAILVGMPEA